jgi:hypothetical protein
MTATWLAFYPHDYHTQKRPKRTYHLCLPVKTLRDWWPIRAVPVCGKQITGDWRDYVGKKAPPSHRCTKCLAILSRLKAHLTVAAVDTYEGGWNDGQRPFTQSGRSKCNDRILSQ